MRLLALLLLLACADPAGDTNAKPMTECDPFCETATCPAVDICVRSKDGMAIATWYETGEGSEFACNGADCTTAAEDMVDYCGPCL